ncbi:MAG: PDDEXK nuclease domain-containing protein [Methanobrevibacter sp.]|jgi:predicted nuclease of restriction endonuclease-like (RecB) superfamily|nr:PDDEXK nuclease domain-containing protein [Candidatus Methanoflexus mossambicus]
MVIEKNEIKLIREIKEKIRKTQYESLKFVNVKLIQLYWEIGKALSQSNIEKSKTKLISSLSSELQKEFPGIKGFSQSNLKYMIRFYNEYNGVENLEPLLNEISWSKHIAILQKCKDNQEREFYILATKKFGWTKNVLINQIENKSYEKFLLNQTNYDKTLPNEIKKQGHLAVKDEYIFDFLELSDKYSEKEMENALIKNIRNFLIEMGTQFAFISNQFKIEVNNKEYFIDLLLYHRQLKCLVAVELKIGEFIPEFKGKMEFYLSVLNEKVKLPDENDAIGIIICKEKDRTIVEYSLKTSNLPIGVSTYKTSKKLPKNYENLLPTSQEISQKLQSFL